MVVDLVAPGDYFGGFDSLGSPEHAETVEAMSIDEEAFAEAFSFNMDPDELTRLLMSMSSTRASSAEANLRLNLTTTAIKPYLVAGAGWKHYAVSNTDVNTSSLEDSDNVLEVPLGVGIGYSFNGFIADVRGTYRPAFDDDLIRSDIGNDDTGLDTWKVGANIGFEF